MTSNSTQATNILNRRISHLELHVEELKAELAALKEGKPYPGCNSPHQPDWEKCDKSSCTHYGVKVCKGCWSSNGGCLGVKEAKENYNAIPKGPNDVPLDAKCQGWKCDQVDTDGSYRTLESSHKIVWMCQDCLTGRW